MSLVQINDSIEFAREIAADIERDLPSEADIQAAVDVMNQHLFGMQANTKAILGASELYELPGDLLDIEFMSDQHIMEVKIERAIARGKIDSFQWIGSVGLTGFGLKMYGVDLLAPTERHANSAFIPLYAVGVRLAA